MSDFFKGDDNNLPCSFFQKPTVLGNFDCFLVASDCFLAIYAITCLFIVPTSDRIGRNDSLSIP